MSTKLKIIIAIVVLVIVAIVWYLITKNKKTIVKVANEVTAKPVKIEPLEYNGVIYLIPETEYFSDSSPLNPKNFSITTPDALAAYLSKFNTRPKTFREQLGL